MENEKKMNEDLDKCSNCGGILRKGAMTEEGEPIDVLVCEDCGWWN